MSVQLSWQPGFSLDRKPLKRLVRRRPRLPNAGQFHFVIEHPSTPAETKKDGVRGDAFPSQVGKATSIPTSPQQANARVVEQALDQVDDTEEADLGPTPSANVGWLSSSMHGGLEEDSTSEAGICNDMWPNEQSGTMTLLSDDLTLAPIPPRSTHIGSPHMTSHEHIHKCPRGVLYCEPWQSWDSVLTRYDFEFSVIPLTHDLPFNPFRCRTNTLEQSPYLLHAVIALSCHHSDNDSIKGNYTDTKTSENALNHGQYALQLFRKAMDSTDLSKIAGVLLDTLIILFSLDEAHSLVGSWITHLKGAYQIIQLRGGVPAWTSDLRQASQVALILWWDAIVSLVNRTPPVFSIGDFESVLADRDERSFSYFGLVGCPESLVGYVIKLAHLAAEKQTSASWRWLSTNHRRVSEIERMLEDWSYESSHLFSMHADNEETVHQDIDRMHTSEAWRHGLLLYIHRVFWWNPGDLLPIRILHRARFILDHACACQNGYYLAKQAALPIFLAGCELTDSWAQNRIRMLFSTWDLMTRYQMFYSMIPLLEQVWGLQGTQGFGNTWWGQVVDGHRQPDSPLDTQICFG